MSKKKFNETKFGQFCKKVSKTIPDIASDVLEIATSGNPIGVAMGKVSDLLQEKSEKDEKAKEALKELQENYLQWELEVYRAEVDDRSRASEMYAKDNNMANHVAKSIIGKNLNIIFALIGVDALVLYAALFIVDDKTLAVSCGTTLGTLVGTVIGSLLQERNQVVGFFFGKGFKRQTSNLTKDAN